MGVQGSDLSVMIKKQSALGTLATGTGATLLRVLPSQGLQRAAATIERGIIDRSGMRPRARQGSITSTAAYETEVEPKNLDIVYGGVLGAVVTAAITTTEADVTSITITGTGTIATTGGGSLITKGIRAGMLVKFTNLSVAGNNGKWVPVLGVTPTTMAFPTGFLVDNAIDSAFTMVTAPCYQTPTVRLKEYFTVEEYISSFDKSRLGEDMRFTNLQFSAAANQVVRAGFGLTGRQLSPLDTAAAPTFTTPDAPEGDALILLDGALYRNGVAAADLTSVTLGLASQATSTPLATSRIAADVGLSQFAFSGQIAGLMTDFDQFQASIDEDRVSMMLLLAERDALAGTSGDLVSIYAGDCSYSQSNAPITDGDVIETTTLYGGKDTRGTGYAPTTFLISRTAA
jgi:hypothetical protein